MSLESAAERARLRDAAFKRQKGLCHWCKTPMLNTKRARRARSPMACTLEHLIPRHIGGPNTEDNTVAACLQCNEERGGAMTPPHSARFAPRAA